MTGRGMLPMRSRGLSWWVGVGLLVWLAIDPVRTVVALVSVGGAYVLLVHEPVARADWNPLRHIRDRVEFLPWVTIMLLLHAAWLGWFIWSAQVAPAVRAVGWLVRVDMSDVQGDGVRALAIMFACLVVADFGVYVVQGGRTK